MLWLDVVCHLSWLHRSLDGSQVGTMYDDLREGRLVRSCTVFSSFDVPRNHGKSAQIL
jgi:hypothetical protein